MKTTEHYRQDRQDRERRIREIGEGKYIYTFVVDRGHKNGPEIHKISDTGIISIFNKRSKRLITKLIAQPYQIKRYFKKGQYIPQSILEYAKYNSYVLGYNY